MPDASRDIPVNVNGINDKHQIAGFSTDAATNTHAILVSGIK